MSWRGWLAFAALGIIWGIPYFFIRLAVQEVSPFVVAWSRLRSPCSSCCPWPGIAERCVRCDIACRAVSAFAVVEFVVPFSADLDRGALDQFLDHGILLGRRSAHRGIDQPSVRSPGAVRTLRIIGLLLGLGGIVALLGFGTLSGSSGWAGGGLHAAGNGRI
ncbi:MAG: hypothetical protein WDM77_21195 [Steroidobacteraceae bacterium]